MAALKLRDTQALDAVLKRYSLPDDASSGTVPGRDDLGLLPGVALAVRGRDGVLYSGSGNSRIQSSTPAIPEVVRVSLDAGRHLGHLASTL
jgi:hypothetical protein